MSSAGWHSNHHKVVLMCNKTVDTESFRARLINFRSQGRKKLFLTCINSGVSADRSGKNRWQTGAATEVGGDAGRRMASEGKCERRL